MKLTELRRDPWIKDKQMSPQEEQGYMRLSKEQLFQMLNQLERNGPPKGGTPEYINWAKVKYALRRKIAR